MRSALVLASTQPTRGALTALPLLTFAVLSPFSVLIGREYGLERSLFGALVLIAVGLVLRSLGLVWCLFLGTGVIGAGIAIANVLLPSLVKRDFPNKIVALTGAYALTAGVVAALASAIAVPVAALTDWGWKLAFATLLVFPLAALAVWAPQLATRTAPAKGTATPAAWRPDMAFSTGLAGHAFLD